MPDIEGNAMNQTMEVLPEGEPAIRVLAMPADTNPAGDIFGGWIMSQVDIAGSIVAFRRASGRVVTVAVNSFQFHQPVFVGDLVSCYAQVVRVGRTSLTVDVQVFAERNRGGGERIKVTEATLTYVAIGPDRRPRPVDNPA
jgi:acyl-CoA thioesterase YciA